MTESLHHRELKQEAIRRLREVGFSDAEIQQEYWVEFDWEDERRRKRIDVVGVNAQRKILYQVGNHSDFEISLLKKFFPETHYIPYPEGLEERSTDEEEEISLRDEKSLLVQTYNKIEKLFEGDDVYDFIKYDDNTANRFKLGKNDAWMIIPTSKTISKNELFGQITLTLGFRRKGKFEIGIFAIQKAAVEIFLDMPESEKTKYIAEFKKLPAGYFIYPGYRRPEKHHSNWVQYWQYEDMRLDPVSLDRKSLQEIEDDCELLLESFTKELPCICLLQTEIDENEIPKALRQIRPVYACIKTLKSFERSIQEKIKSLDKWEWHLEQHWYEPLYQMFNDKYPDESVPYDEFRSILLMLKKDPAYVKYVEV